MRYDCSYTIHFRLVRCMAGVENVDANVEEQKIRVKGSAASNQMLEALRKWGEASGKKVELAS